MANLPGKIIRQSSCSEHHLKPSNNNIEVTKAEKNSGSLQNEKYK